VRVPLEQERQREVPPPKEDAIGSFSVKEVAHMSRMLLIITSIGDGLFRFINIDDLEPLK